MAVAATAGRRSNLFVYGATAVDLGAPGVLIVSTTPQNSYSYFSGTSMAVPHVTAAAAFAHAARGFSGARLRDTLLAAADRVPALAGRTVTGGRLNLARLLSTTVPTGSAGEIVLLAKDASTVSGNWAVKSDTTAAGGARLQSTNAGAARVAPALAAPANYFELTFSAEAGRPYHLWLRSRAESNNWATTQCTSSSTAASARAEQRSSASAPPAAPRSISKSAAARPVGLGLAGQRLRGRRVGSALFREHGPQRLRIQTREDGLGIDQIVLSPGRYLSRRLAR